MVDYEKEIGDIKYTDELFCDDGEKQLFSSPNKSTAFGDDGNVDELFSKAYENPSKPKDSLFSSEESHDELNDELFSEHTNELNVDDSLIESTGEYEPIDEKDELFSVDIEEEENIILKTPQEVIDSNIKSLSDFFDVNISITSNNFLSRLSTNPNEKIYEVEQKLLLKKALDSLDKSFEDVVIDFISENEGRKLSISEIVTEEKLFETYKRCYDIKNIVVPKMKEALILKKSSEKIAKLEEIEKNKILAQLKEINERISSTDCVGIYQMINHSYICGNCGERNDLDKPLYEINILSKDSPDRVIVLPKYDNCSKCSKMNILPYTALDRIKSYVSKDVNSLSDNSGEIKKLQLSLTTLRNVCQGIIDINLSDSFSYNVVEDEFNGLNFTQYYRNLEAFRVRGDATELLMNYLARDITIAKIITAFLSTELYSKISEEYYKLKQTFNLITSASIYKVFLSNIYKLDILKDYDEETELRESFCELKRITGISSLRWYIDKDEKAHWSNLLLYDDIKYNIDILDKYINVIKEKYSELNNNITSLKNDIPNCDGDLIVSPSLVENYTNVWKIFSVDDIRLFSSLKDNYIKSNLKRLLMSKMMENDELMGYLEGDLRKIKPKFLKPIFGEDLTKKFKVTNHNKEVFYELYNKIFIEQSVNFNDEKLCKLLELPIEYIKTEIASKNKDVIIIDIKYNLDNMIDRLNFISNNIKSLESDGYVERKLNKQHITENEDKAIRDITNEFTSEVIENIGDLEFNELKLDIDKLIEDVIKLYELENTK